MCVNVWVPAENCSGYRTCGQCLEQPGCGWCTHPNNTGKGQCMEGSYRGPMRSPAKLNQAQGQQGLPLAPSQDMVLEPALCPKDKGYEWAFIQCPGKPLLCSPPFGHPPKLDEFAITRICTYTQNIANGHVSHIKFSLETY